MPVPNSRIISIYRSKNFLERAQGSDVGEYFSEAKTSIGSTFVKDQQRVATGLSFKEQDLLMPYVIQMESDERGFRTKVEEFFADLDIKVTDKGLKLEVGLEESNDSPVSKTNMPINILDYVKYKLSLIHPWVAMNKEEGEGNSTKRFYIHDPEQVKKKQNKVARDQDGALKAYLEVSKNPLKVDMLLTLLGTDPRILDKDTDIHTQKLKEKALSDPDNFVKVLGQDNFETRYMIEFMLKTGVLKKLGVKYQDSETKAIIGHDLDETIAFFTDPNNDQILISYKARLQEAAKKPVDPAIRRTELK
jgi:hypothetical protein